MLSLEAICLTSIVCALAFYGLARFRLAGLVRYIPFSVMAGFLASTGWLMCSGALNIISGTPLSMVGLHRLLANPARPELLAGLAVVAVLFALSPKLSGAVLIPLVMLAATALVNVFLASGSASGLAEGALHSRDAWLFSGLQGTPWVPVWKLGFSLADARALLELLPSMLVVSFVGLLTILLSMASLELSFKKEFELDNALKTHAVTAGVAALLGGFVGIISIGRTTLNKSAGGGALSCAIAALICFAMLLGAGGIISYVPRAALGGLVLYLGVNMLKQWLWDQRKATARHELAQIVLILVLVANFGYLVGFAAGVVISCIIFVVTYSRLPLATLATDLALFPSSVVRPAHQMEVLRAQGHRTVIYRLGGYVFFGSASKIDQVFQEMNVEELDAVVLDFSLVSGIDRSAIGVFQRILRRYDTRPLLFHFVHTDSNQAAVRLISEDSTARQRISYSSSLDQALEAAEERILLQSGHAIIEEDCFGFLDSEEDREIFRSHCEVKSIAKGEALCRDGDFSDAIYFVDSGGFDITKEAAGETGRRLANFRTGAMVGEMAFYTAEARTASIIADVDSRVYILHREALEALRAAHPGLVARLDHVVIRKISHSLTRANNLIATLG
jgi:SulP family sulfate permease